MSTTMSDARITRGIRAALIVSGALALVFGVLILVWPGRVAVALTLLIGIYAIAGGLVYAGLGLFARGTGGWSRVGHVVLGLLYVAAGVAILANAVAATTFLAAFIGIAVGIVWVVEGVVALSTLTDASSRAWTVFFAIVSILAGVALVFSPVWGAAVLWWLVGISAVVLGVLQIVRGIRWGRP